MVWREILTTAGTECFSEQYTRGHPKKLVREIELLFGTKVPKALEPLEVIQCKCWTLCNLDNAGLDCEWTSKR